jgi:minor extracellular serine protease Vpr
MTRRALLGISVFFVLLLAVGQAFASGVPSRDFTEAPATATQDEFHVVLLNDPPAASYTGGISTLPRTKPERGARLDPDHPAVVRYVAHLRDEQARYIDWLARTAPAARVEATYALVANAVAVRRGATSANTLARGPGVRAVVPSALYRPTMNVSNDLIAAPAVWAALGGRADAGAGIDIAIIDTGIDFSHPFFGCKTDPPDAKVYFSGDGLVDPDLTIFFDHGTHVAGTAAGCHITLAEGPVTGDISGVAPGATLHDYNVFPGYGAGFVAFGGSAFSHDIIAALEDTVLDGIDVVNMSLGGTVQGPFDTLAEAVNATVDAGLVVAVAAGNSGPGDATVDSPGSAEHALTAGASTNPHFIGIPVTFESADATGSGTIGAALGEFENFDPPLTAAYTVTEPALGCSAISTDLTGMIALIDRGVCTFTTKIRNAENAGAVGVLVVNNVAGDPVGMAHDGTEPFPTIPAAMVGVADGAAMKPAGTATVDGTHPQEVISDNADIIAGFSSRGPTPFTGLVKPDLTAPGVNVYSAVFDGEFEMFQGTSMASPHLAGAAALLLDLHPGWSPADVKSAMVTTADRPVTDHVTGALPTGVLTRGGGRLNVEAASQAPTRFDPASVSFGVFEGNRSVEAERLVTVSGATCTAAVDGPGIVSVAPATVGDGQQLTVTLNAGRASQTPSGDYEGDLVLVCDGRQLRVPWFVRIDRGGRP